MFYEVDEALRALVRTEVLDGSDVEVVFDAPTKDWSSRRNAPTVNLYLYDIREDMRRRARGVENEYDGNGRIIGRHLPPRHFKLSYLVTAWTQRPEDEHRLLSAQLTCFLRHDAIPQDLVTGPLLGQEHPVDGLLEPWPGLEVGDAVVRQRPGEPAAEGLRQVLLLDDVEDGVGGGGAQRVAGIGIAVTEGAELFGGLLEHLADLVTDDHGGQRHVGAGEALGEGDPLRAAHARAPSL